MENKNCLSNYLIGFIGMIFLVTLSLFLLFLHSKIKYSNSLSREFIFSIICGLIVMMIYMYIVCSLKFIMNNIKKRRAFCRANIKRLNSIGKFFILAGILEVVGNYFNKEEFSALNTSSLSIKSIIVLYMVVTCLIFILAQVFEEAGKTCA